MMDLMTLWIGPKYEPDAGYFSFDESFARPDATAAHMYPLLFFLFIPMSSIYSGSPIIAAFARTQQQNSPLNNDTLLDDDIPLDDVTPLDPEPLHCAFAGLLEIKM
jgi:hypothetical protein